MNGHAKVVDSLLVAGAGPGRGNETSVLPLPAAARLDDPGMLRPLGTAGHNQGNENSTLRTASMLCPLPRNGADPNRGNDSGVFPLSAAARRGDVGMLRALRAAGADLDRADRKGETPLFTAVKLGHTAAVAALIDLGADVNKADKKRSSPLLAAAWSGFGGIVDTLLVAGANVDKCNDNGTTALWVRTLCLHDCQHEH